MCICAPDIALGLHYFRLNWEKHKVPQLHLGRYKCDSISEVTFATSDVCGFDEDGNRQRFRNQTAMIYLSHHSSYMKRVRKPPLCPVTRQTFEQKSRTSPIHYSSRVYKVSMTSELWESVSRTKGTKSFMEVKISCFCCKVTTACR